jgi:hypothetical protein
MNDLRVSERHTPRPGSENHRRPGKTRYRYFLGVKWSQVQILSARPENVQVRAISADLSSSESGTGPRYVRQPADKAPRTLVS